MTIFGKLFLIDMQTIILKMVLRSVRFVYIVIFVRQQKTKYTAAKCLMMVVLYTTDRRRDGLDCLVVQSRKPPSMNIEEVRISATALLEV